MQNVGKATKNVNTTAAKHQKTRAAQTKHTHAHARTDTQTQRYTQTQIADKAAAELVGVGGLSAV